MSECEKLPTCPFFNGEMSSDEELGKTYRAYYCHNGNAVCARYHVFQTLGKEFVPTDLYPDQLNRAKQIIADVDAARSKSEVNRS